MANESMGLIGRKVGMTQIFSDTEVIPVTVIQAGPCTITQIKTADSSDGYNAIQLGFDEKKNRRATKAEIGHAKTSGLEKAPKVLREVRVSAETLAGLEKGKTISASEVFAEGDFADVTSTSKGRGFAGVMKRHNFQGFIRSHGTHEFFRHGGSIGTRLTPGHVLKGKKMPGHMGAERVTVQNLKIARVDEERGLVFVRGGVPGPNGCTVVIRKAIKKG